MEAKFGMSIFINSVWLFIAGIVAFLDSRESKALVDSRHQFGIH